MYENYEMALIQLLLKQKNLSCVNDFNRIHMLTSSLMSPMSMGLALLPPLCALMYSSSSSRVWPWSSTSGGRDLGQKSINLITLNYCTLFNISVIGRQNIWKAGTLLHATLEI